jgi:hypothetical protein
LAGAILGGSNSALAGLARLGIQVGAGSIMMKYSRDGESQADSVGAIILYKAGYSPMAMADFFQKLAEEGGGRGPQFLSDHPNPGNRQQAIKKQIAPWPQKSMTTNSQAFQTAKQHATTVKAYDAQTIANGAKSGQWAQQNEKTGAVLKGAPPPTAGGNGAGTITNVSLPEVRPSGNFKSLNLDFLSIQYPDNWQVMQDQQQQQSGITIAPKAGVSGSAIAYGAVINGANPPNGQSMNFDQMTTEIVNSIAQGNNAKPVGSPQKINVNGVSGRSVELISQSPIQGNNGQPLQERDWLVTVPRSDGSVIYLVFVAPQPDFDNLRPTFQSMLKSLRVQ